MIAPAVRVVWWRPPTPNLLRVLWLLAFARDVPAVRALPAQVGGETLSPIPSGPEREDALRHLLKRTRDGDAEAYTQIYRTYVRLVLYYLCRRLGQSDELEALTNETFLQAYTALGRYEHRPEAAWRGWLLGVARLVALGHGRRELATVPIERAEHLTADGPATDAAIDRLDLDRALAALTDEQQRVLRLRFFARLSNAEIAAQLACTPESVRSLQYRALERLRAILAERGR